MVLQYFQRYLARLSNRLRHEALEQARENTETSFSAPAISTRSVDKMCIDLPPTSCIELEMNNVESTDTHIDRVISSDKVTTVASALDEAFQDVDSVLAAEQQELSDDPLLAPSQAHNPEARNSQKSLVLTNDFGKSPCTLSRPSSPTSVQIEPFYFARANLWTAAMGHQVDSSKNKVDVSDHSDRTAEFDLELDSSDEDIRCCLLCGHHGDSNIEGRLLFTGADTWVSYSFFFCLIVLFNRLKTRNLFVMFYHGCTLS